MKNKILISLIAGLILSAVTLYLAFRNVPFQELIQYVYSIDYIWIFPAALVAIISFAIRTVRWQIIVSATRRLSFWDAFHPLMIGFMMNCVLPGRLGEIARPAILKKKEAVPFTTGLATVAAERVFDIVLLIPMFLVVLATVEIDPNINIEFAGYQLNRSVLEFVALGMTRLCAVIIIGIFLVSFSKTRYIINRMILWVPKLFRFAGPRIEHLFSKICAIAVNINENIASGFSMLQSPAKIIACVLLSALVWVVAAWSYYLFSLGCPGIHLSFLEISAMMIVIIFFIALPSVPGFWGLWEAGGVFALSLFGVLTKDAAGYTLANHAVQIFPVIIVGFISAMITGINIWRVSFDER